jgi:hypothetical protein
MLGFRSTRRIRYPFQPLLLELETRVVPSFMAPRVFDAGNTPVSLAVGDFNGDGIPDLAVAVYDSNSVSVLLGNGDGSFQPAHSFVAGPGPASVAVGDFNGDGIHDLAVAKDAVGGTVSVLLGNGDGSFRTTNFAYVAGDQPASVAVGDFNRDGWPDLVVANYHSNSVSIFLNDGAWTGPLSGAGGGAPHGHDTGGVPKRLALRHSAAVDQVVLAEAAFPDLRPAALAGMPGPSAVSGW